MKDATRSGQARELSGQAAYHQIALDMAADLPSSGPVRLKMISDSMAPMLRPGDIIVMFPLVAGITLQRGDMIVFQPKNALSGELPLTHRLIGSHAAGWVTKGDNRLFPDAPINKGDVLGKVIAYQRGPHQVDLSTPSWILVNGMLGWFHFGIGSLMTAARRIRKALTLR